MSRRRCKPSDGLPRRSGPLWLAFAALAWVLVAIPVAPESVRAAGYESAGYETGEYDTANYGDRARVQWRQEPTTSRKVFDLVLMRPFQFAQLIISAVAFVPAYVVASPFGGGDDVRELCLTEPKARLFDKPLGEL